MDLGCGTGWLLDHLEPSSYVGVDSSPVMLAELVRKHPEADARCCEVGVAGWADELPTVDAVVATWAADYFPNLDEVLTDASLIVAPAGVIALHGYQPRGRRRRHCVDHDEGPGDWSAEHVAVAGEIAELPAATCVGTGALPDPLAHWRWLWRVALRAPWRWHYGALHVWRV